MNHFESFNNSNERIITVDALRGFALMGLFLVHCSEYFDLYWIDPKPSVVHDVIFFLFAGKSYAIFALLFGLSFYFILEGEKKRGNAGNLRYIWRLFVLFLIGCLHTLVYAGDILQVLAVLGIILWAMNYLRTSWVVALGIFFLLNGYLIYHLYAALAQLPKANDMPMHWILSPPLFETWTKGTLGECLKINAWSGALSKWYFYLESGRLFQMVGLFMIGLWIGRIRLLHQLKSLKKPIQATGWIALGVGTFLFMLLHYVKTLPNGIITEQGFAKYYANLWLDGYLALALVAMWCILFLMASGNSIGQKILHLLAPAGRMSLTLYVMQSLVCVPIYYGWGLEWYRTCDQTRSLLLGIIIFGFQLIFAHWWMNRFKYGPLEWLWRSAVYFTWVRIK